MNDYLVVGGYGFIGSHFCKKLSDNDKFYDIFDTMQPNGNPCQEIISKRIKLARNDNAITNVGELKKNMPNYEAVIYFASLAGPRNNHADIEYFQKNVCELQSFMELLSPEQKFVYISSSSVFGDIETPYSISKKIAENIVRKHPNHLIVRPFTVYGKFGRPEMLISRCIEAKKSGKKITINGNPDKIFRKYTYVGDFVEALYGAMRQGITGNLNVIGAQEYSITDIMKIFSCIYDVTDFSDKDFMAQKIDPYDLTYFCYTKIEDVSEELAE